MDPPAHKTQYTIEDFLSTKKIAVCYSDSEDFRALTEFLIAEGRNGD